MRSIYLARHGAIGAEARQRFIGHTDLPLSTEGQEQIALLADFLQDRSISKIYCSPLSRCQQSAEIISRRIPVPVSRVPAFAEINLGDWEGLPRETIKKQYPEDYAARGEDLAGFRPPGGESFCDLLNRAWPAFVQIAREEKEPVLIMAHAGVNRVLLTKILGMELAHLFSISQDYACCTHIEQVQGQEFRLAKIKNSP